MPGMPFIDWNHRAAALPKTCIGMANRLFRPLCWLWFERYRRVSARHFFRKGERSLWPGSRGIRWSFDFPLLYRVSALFAERNLHLVILPV